MIALNRNSILITAGAALNFIWYWLEAVGVLLFLIIRSPIVFIRRTAVKKQQQGQQAEAISAGIETDLKNIILDIFCKCYENGEYTLLIKAGHPTAEQLQRAWTKILSDFYELSEDINAKRYVEISIEILQLESREKEIPLIIEALRQRYDERLINILKSEPYYYNRPFTPETLAHDLDKIVTAEKRFKIMKTRHERTLSEMFKQSAGEPTETAKKSYIYENLFEIKKHESLPQSPTELMRSLSVADYCVYLKRLREHAAFLERQRMKQQREGRG